MSSSTGAAAVLQESEPMGEDASVIKGPDFEKEEKKEMTVTELMDNYKTFGFQATNVGRAVEIVNEMLEGRQPGELASETGCKIWLTFTSNLISSGLREIFVFLAKHKLVDVICTSAGGVEEDIIKCLAPTVVGDYSLKGAELRAKGWNRIGNMLVPNKNYILFEEWLQPLLDEMWEEQEKGELWTPSKMIHRLGERIGNEESLYYWCWKNDIPVFCPAITDGSIGDNLFFHSYKKDPAIRVDLVQDIRRVNEMAMRHTQGKSAMLILGGGIPKHHACNAHLMRNGADLAVYINTAQEFDGSDSGGNPEEAISWGKIRTGARQVKVCAEATVVFPLLAAASFVRWWREGGGDGRERTKSGKGEDF
uniref:deoxyhypusine synthase n=1 Tax=Chromera velia CCMP2878 TaxID=1169474 RepID=A0A0G4FEN7_9ALVE|mmetsp:Transcript_29168/g.57188  ORF Transcript_29168/g.57188 Transcript_29168/m.57188 type:complete len:365 (-) Transcript_29168:137-1231(-)|eukprot:Cvel_3265.t1-p1 / transcript=Cvel_3265.t1 / gene=Cvel_3265 / organism=Chromera_velia_CCMP2878 / gene_product=Deoxyhypusine synthase, putative / transcript_product=Deoxyhypusine synthase, putative / location=Cvel_scaffold128:47037-51145(-) / protein_length=364 / sequence_SO=supercontig / SO=protein_coding / is_pseudo=false